tara:strand:+ start:1742 stop:4306 length:2565 start_codon:yes stop_codon:yes gene_type:complete
MALVTQKNIPKSGQIDKDGYPNPSQGNSFIQNNLTTPPAQGGVDNFGNPTLGDSFIQANPDIHLQHPDGDNFENLTRAVTWKSEGKKINLNNGEGIITHGVGIPDTTVGWSVSNSGNAITLDYSPIIDRYNSSRIQANLTDGVYTIMSADQQRKSSGPRASLWNSEPHIITRPHQAGETVAGNSYVDKLQAFGIPFSPQDAVRYGRHLLSPRGLQFLNRQNDLTSRNPYEEAFDGNTFTVAGKFSPKVFNPLAVYVSRALPAHMIRYTDPKYGDLVNALVGGSPLRSLALEGLQRLSKNIQIKLPNSKIVDEAAKLSKGEITIGQGTTNLLQSFVEGKAIEKVDYYGRKLLNNLNRPEKDSTVSDKPPAQPKPEEVKITFPSDYRDNKPYVLFTTFKNHHFGDPNRSHWLGMQIFNFSPLKADANSQGTPIASRVAWKDSFIEQGIRYTVEKNEQVNRQYGYKKSTEAVGNTSGLTAPDNTGETVTMVNEFDKGTSYDSIDKQAKQDSKKEKLESTIETRTELQAPNNVGTLVTNTNFYNSETKYNNLRTEEEKPRPVINGDNITTEFLDVANNKKITKTATNTAHIDGKTPDGDGNYSLGGIDAIDKYKAHLYSDIVEKRDPKNVNLLARNKTNVNGTNHSNMGTAGRVAPGDVYLGDVINLEPIQELSSLDETGKELDDSIVFKIKIMNTKELIVLRAFIEELGDSVTPNWSAINYIGKPDPLYVYKGAERKMSLKFSLASFSSAEHKVLWNKANKLIGLNYPTYAELSGGGKRMVPPMIRLTVGDYVSDQPGFFENINITPKDNSFWEIEKGRQLPHHLDVNCSFVMIGDHLPDLENPKFYNIDGAQKTTT